MFKRIELPLALGPFNTVTTQAGRFQDRLDLTVKADFVRGYGIANCRQKNCG